MSLNAQSELAGAIRNLIDNHLDEWDMTLPEVIGVLEDVKLRIWLDASTGEYGEKEERSPEEEDGDANCAG